MLYAAVIIVVLGIGLGLLAGLRPGWIDSSVLVISSMAAAVPAFVAAIVLIAVFAVSLGWFPTIGVGEGFLGHLEHLTLPAVALALSSVAVVARVTRTAIREEVEREHVQTAISRGIPQHLVVTRHVLRNAAIPITTVTGVTIASLIAISSVVETSFGLNGLGQYLVKSAQGKDIAVVQGISLVLVVAFVIVNVVVDAMYAVLDPASSSERGPHERRRHRHRPRRRHDGDPSPCPSRRDCVGLRRRGRARRHDRHHRAGAHATRPEPGRPGAGVDRSGGGAPARSRRPGPGRAVPGPGRRAVLAARAAAHRGPLHAGGFGARSCLRVARGAVDTTVSAGLDILFAFPGVLLAALTAAVFGAGLWAAVLAMAVAYTPFVARLLRSAMLKERSQPYITALEVQGLGATAICVRHLLPNVFPFMVAQASILFGYAVLDLAVISYLGIGVQPPNPDWGVMISENQSGILLGYPMPALVAGVCIVVVVVAMNLLGERLLERAGKEGGR